jgi:hypothetical protein
MRYISVTIILLLFAMNACVGTDTSIQFSEMENGLARFELVNRTTSDIQSLDLELTFIGPGNSALRTDTVSYASTKPDGSQEVFLKAKSSTFIVQKAPEGTLSAKGRIVNVKLAD